MRCMNAPAGSPPRTVPAQVWARGDAYEQYVGRWSRRVAEHFLAWLDLPPGLRWLDLGCGTGVLASTILQQCQPLSVAGVEPSEGFLARARELLGERVVLQRGSADAIPLAPGAVDVTASALVLNFLPDPAAGLREMMRVTAPGGTVAAYVWDYAGRMDMMRQFWDAARALDPAAADEGPRFPLCQPEPLTALFRDAGLTQVAVQGLDIPMVFADFDDYWQPFLGGTGPAPAYAMALPEAARDRLRERLRRQLPTTGDGSITLTARAWAVRGRLPGSLAVAARPGQGVDRRGGA